MKTKPSNALRHLIRTSKRTLLLSVIALMGIVVLAWGATRTFSKLAQEFREETVKEFVGYVVKGERYPMVHAIYELRYRLFQSKLGINNKSETKACSRRRAFGAEVPEDQLDFCRRYDEFVDLAKQQIILPKVFEHLYYETEPFLIREIERRKARDAIRVWIRQKLRCLKDKYRCGRDERGLLVVEDAAQALGSRYRGRCAGTFGLAGMISLYPAKLLGCLGDGGLVLTNDDGMAGQLRLLRDHGRNEAGEVVSWGVNSRLDTVQAAVLLAKFRHYPSEIERRREIAARYRMGLSGLSVMTLPPGPEHGPAASQLCMFSP